MNKSTWIRDAFFIAVVAGVVLSIGYSLMSSDRIEMPENYAPNSQHRQQIEDVVARVDLAFRDMWEEADVEPAEHADPLTIARRLGLGLAGTIPSLEEIRVMESLPEEDRVYWWVTRLLQDERTGDHIAERYMRALVGVEDGPFLIFRRRRFRSWMAERFLEQEPYDKLVRQILTDEGIWTDTPSVNFYTRAVSEDNGEQPDPILLAGRTSRAFLGMRIDCLQCHDDFLGNIDLGSASEPRGGMQTDFHSLAAFFAQTENSVLGIRDNPERGPYMYKLLDENEESEIEAQVPFLNELDDGQGNLRGRLARWVTHEDNRPFARAAVNRMWAIMTGRALLQPVDDIPIDGPFPPAMEVLADDFVHHNFDLHRLIHVISQTRAYQLASTHRDEVTQEHVSNWAVYPMVRLRPDQAAGAIAQSTQFSTIDKTAHILTRLTKFGQENDFIQRFGDPGEDEFEDRGETVTQRLLMLNGNMISERLKSVLSSCSLLSQLSPNAETTVETVYLATLSRRPNQDEKERFIAVVEDKFGNDRKREVLDIYWSLINSAEFRWNH
ncbi:MAG: DUF1553 domain-containing protein [Planctomycetota bacterium]